MINDQLFAAYLACPTKCVLKATGLSAETNPVAKWLNGRAEKYRQAGIQKLRGSDGWVFDQAVVTSGLETRIHAVETVVPQMRRQVVPLRFTPTNKLSRQDRLLIGFDGFVLSKSLGLMIGVGQIKHGEGFASVSVKFDRLFKEVDKVIQRIANLLEETSTVTPVLNRHCPECEFRDYCRKTATERDDLSLLLGLSSQARARWNRRGIFTVHQLSYVFRPRRRPKRFREKPAKYQHSLQALAIREKKTHIVGVPSLRLEGTPVFLDVEGIPDRDFFYLIGVSWSNDTVIERRHFWAEEHSDEERIWRDLIDLLSSIDRPALVHYGSYEKTFLRTMCGRYGEPAQGTSAARAVAAPVNLLSVLFGSIYFPTYSNGLKDIARSVGFEWTDPLASGLQSIVWRCDWEQSRDPVLRDRLVTYNSEDCDALRIVAGVIHRLTEETDVDSEAVRVDRLTKSFGSKWRNFESPVSGLVQINATAHWNYQRDHVFVRHAPPRGHTSKGIAVKHRSPDLVEGVLKVSQCCPKCSGEWREEGASESRKVHDMVFGHDSIKHRVVRYTFRTVVCGSCGYRDGIQEWYRQGRARKWGWNVLAYFVYNAVGLRIPQRTIHRSVNRLFGCNLTRSALNNLKFQAASYYAMTAKSILTRIATGSVIHADETGANIKGQSAYVWVLTNLHQVAYILMESREGQFLKDLLKDFKGILVSDFYAVYDSIECPQQKCLVHLMRDLNDELLANPFDEETKAIVTRFASLLKPIIETIDRRGLKKYFLKKHQTDVGRFYRWLEESSFRSEAPLKCKQRFLKNRDKLFTFLEYDGVPWHNNNAEHAIKAFARLRTVISGTSTKKGLEEYLTLLTVAETCEYSRIDFLGFLRSGVRDVPSLGGTRRRTGQWLGSAPIANDRSFGERPNSIQA